MESDNSTGAGRRKAARSCVRRERLFHAKKALDLSENSISSLCDISSQISQLRGHALDDIGQLIRIQINSQKAFDHFEGICGELRDQILITR